MKGTLHHSAPPGYITATDAAAVIGKTRSNFNAVYGQMFDRWLVGPGRGTLLYLESDIADLAHWLVVREGLVALGIWGGNHPYVPESGEFHLATQEGYWDATCPRCGGEAVGEPTGAKVWCPKCDKSKS